MSTNCYIPRLAEKKTVSSSTERGLVFIFAIVGATSQLCTLYHTAYVHVVIFRSIKRRRHRCELVLTRQTKSFSQSDKPIPTQHSTSRGSQQQGNLQNHDSAASDGIQTTVQIGKIIVCQATLNKLPAVEAKRRGDSSCTGVEKARLVFGVNQVSVSVGCILPYVVRKKFPAASSQVGGAIVSMPRSSKSIILGPYFRFHGLLTVNAPNRHNFLLSLPEP